MSDEIKWGSKTIKMSHQDMSRINKARVYFLNDDLRKHMPSALKVINYCFLQWFFIRLQKTIDIESDRVVRWGIIKWIIPLTGWSGPYKYIGKNKDV